ncbi:MAG: hypothetical protein NVSMB27_47760 [Ktedonobacteraceae bacterium]
MHLIPLARGRFSTPSTRKTMEVRFFCSPLLAGMPRLRRMTEADGTCPGYALDGWPFSESL